LLICLQIAVLKRITVSFHGDGHLDHRLTSSAKDDSVPGRRQTAIP
jgi:hypothetical protein